MNCAVSLAVVPAPPAPVPSPTIRSWEALRLATFGGVPSAPASHEVASARFVRVPPAAAAGASLAPGEIGSQRSPIASSATCKGMTCGSPPPMESATAWASGRPRHGESVAASPCARSAGTAPPRLLS
eukprot:6212217-Pleurochrysis_carterae.AAC.2